MLLAVAFIVVGYLIGAVPTGYLIAKRLKGIDIREHGSGNVGATNVKRVVGNKAGLATLILDFLKGFIPVLMTVLVFPKDLDPYHLVPIGVGVAAVVGHSRSIYLGFTGGKSVITSVGVLLALEPVATLIVAAIAITTMKMTRYVSVGSMLGALLVPLVVWLLHGPLSHIIMALLIGLYVIYLHRGNIQRLLTHQENRL